MPPTPSAKAPAPITATPPAPFTLAAATAATAATAAATAAVATKPGIQFSVLVAKRWLRRRSTSYKLRATASNGFLSRSFPYSGMNVIDLFFRFKMAFDMSYFVWK